MVIQDVSPTADVSAGLAGGSWSRSTRWLSMRPRASFSNGSN